MARSLTELAEGDVLGSEAGEIAVGDGHEVRVETGGAGEANEEHGELVIVATLLLEDVERGLWIGDAYDLLLTFGTLAGEAGVVHLLHGGIELAELVFGVVASAEEQRGCAGEARR